MPYKWSPSEVSLRRPPVLLLFKTHPVCWACAHSTRSPSLACPVKSLSEWNPKLSPRAPAPNQGNPQPSSCEGSLCPEGDSGCSHWWKYPSPSVSNESLSNWQHGGTALQEAQLLFRKPHRSVIATQKVEARVRTGWGPGLYPSVWMGLWRGR